MNQDDNDTVCIAINIEYELFVEPDKDGFFAYCPALRGLYSCGATEEEAKKNGRSAIDAYLCSLIKHGDPIPIGDKTTYTSTYSLVHGESK